MENGGTRKMYFQFSFLLQTVHGQECCHPKGDPFSLFHRFLGGRESSLLSHNPTEGLQRPCNLKIAF